MIEALIERDELVLDTPFFRRIRRQLEEQRQKALEEGQKIGLEEGVIQARQQDILDLIAWRYDPTVLEYRQIEKQLLTIRTKKELSRIFETAARSEKFSDFQAVVEKCMNDRESADI